MVPYGSLGVQQSLMGPQASSLTVTMALPGPIPRVVLPPSGGRAQHWQLDALCLLQAWVILKSAYTTGHLGPQDPLAAQQVLQVLGSSYRPI